MSCLLEELARAMEWLRKGGEMTQDIIDQIREADKVINADQFEKCVWCGEEIQPWKEMLHQGHAQYGPCNEKEKQCYDLLIDLCENYNHGDRATTPYDPDARKVLNEIAGIIRETNFIEPKGG